MKAKEKVGIETLKASPNNPRIINEWQRKALSKSLERFGDLGGIVFNRRTSRLVGGHQRVEAFRGEPEATVTLVEILRQPDRCGTVAVGFVEVNGTRHSYREVDWDEPTEAAANIAANQHGGEFNDDMLRQIVGGLKGIVDLDILGFGENTLDKLLKTDAVVDAKVGSLNNKVEYAIIVECRDEAHQVELLERLAGDGLTCRPLIG